jgi:hypothetical protein
LDATPTHARKSGLSLLQQDVLTQRNAVLGNHRNFADTVNAYIEKKLGIVSTRVEKNRNNEWSLGPTSSWVNLLGRPQQPVSFSLAFL